MVFIAFSVFPVPQVDRLAPSGVQVRGSEHVVEGLAIRVTVTVLFGLT